VTTASDAHTAGAIDFDDLQSEHSFKPMATYGMTKLANILFTRELGRRLGAKGQTANTLHPGVISTGITRTLPGLAQAALRMASPLVLKTAAQGAATQCYLAASPDVASVTGAYYADCNPSETTPIARDMTLAAKLWAASEALVARI
jgi:NAD(P)-dependent dehydrogenase (short-subunit alcohol dehydrogenase family)